MPDRLQMDPDELRACGSAALDAVVRYLETLDVRPVMPDTTSAAIRNLLDEPLPRSGCEFPELLKRLETSVLPLIRHNGHPRFFGYVASPAAPVTALGNLLASALNSNVTSWRSSPAGTELEHTVVGWLRDMAGFAPEAAGLLVSGGSMANFAALAAARSAKAAYDVKRRGMQDSMRVYVSEEGHSSIAKGAALLGIGEDNVQTIPADDNFRIDTGELEQRIRRDLSAGLHPVGVVANAGTVATGAIDPLEDVAAIARRYDLWMHVDGAYGALAAAVPSVRPFFRGMEQADSLTLDPHKWLYASMGCGCVFYRDPHAARRAFGHEADYLRVIGFERDEAFAFWDYGPELSRRFRALPVWLLIKHAGADAIAAAIERNIACARHFERLVRESNDLEMLAPVELSIFCFRVKPTTFAGDLDALNERVLIELQRAGNSYLSNARLKGRFALRGCVLNYRTTEKDMEILLDDVRQAASRVLSS